MTCWRKPISSLVSSSSITSLVLFGEGGSSFVFTRLFAGSRREPMEIDFVRVLGPDGGDGSLESGTLIAVIDLDRGLGR